MWEHRDTKKIYFTVFSQEKGEGHTFGSKCLTVQKLTYRYREGKNEGSRSNTSTFYLLLDLLTFFDYYHEGNVDEAFEVQGLLHCLFLWTFWLYFFLFLFLKFSLLFYYFLVGDEAVEASSTDCWCSGTQSECLQTLHRWGTVSTLIDLQSASQIRCCVWLYWL